jgi:hypothetical protein
MKSSVAVVDQQLAAYNSHDLEAFVSCYAEDVLIFRMPATEAALVGRQALAEFYAAKRFNLPGLHANIVNRMALGNKVVDHERISGLEPGKLVEVVAIYEVRDGLIRTVWFHYPG